MEFGLTTTLLGAGVLGLVVGIPLGAKWWLDQHGRRAYDRCADAWRRYAAGHGLTVSSLADGGAPDKLALQGTTYGVALTISTPRVRAYWRYAMPGARLALDDRTEVSARPSQPPGGTLLIERRDFAARIKPVTLEGSVATGDNAFDAVYAARAQLDATVTAAWLTRSRRAALVQFDTKLRAVYERAWFYLLVDDTSCQLVWSGMEPNESVLDAACGVVAACAR